MLTVIIGFIGFVVIFTGISNCEWGTVAVAGVILLFLWFASSIERRDNNAWNNRQNWWAYGEEPDWKRRQRAEQTRRNNQRRGEIVIKYRPHRATLHAAMQEAREFETYEDMKRHVWREHAIWNTDGVMPFDLDDIVIGDVIGDDDRIGWKNVRYVCVKRYCGDDYMKLYGCPQCIGMCGE